MRLRIESIAFGLIRQLSLPVQLKFRLARSKPKQLSYSQFLAMRKLYPTIPRSTAEDQRKHQLKWANRIYNLASNFKVHTVLEVGAGHGIASKILNEYGLQVHATDLRDIVPDSLRGSGVHFSVSDACKCLPYPSRKFDMVFSINSFEHFDSPEASLDEMLRITRPGGLIYLIFDPLYYSPWGLHANRRLGMPYPQILFSESDIQRFVDEYQAEIIHTYSPDSNPSKISPPLNRLPLNRYRQMFDQRNDLLKLLVYIERIRLDGLGMIVRYPGLFKAHAPTFDDLIVSGIKLVGVRKVGTDP